MEKSEIKQGFEEDQLKLIGDALKRLRIDKGYTNYEYLAYEIGMARSQYGPYENGKNLTLFTLLKILNFHGLSLKVFCEEYL